MKNIILLSIFISMSSLLTSCIFFRGDDDFNEGPKRAILSYSLTKGKIVEEQEKKDLYWTAKNFCRPYKYIEEKKYKEKDKMVVIFLCDEPEKKEKKK